MGARLSVSNVFGSGARNVTTGLKALSDCLGKITQVKFPARIEAPPITKNKGIDWARQAAAVFDGQSSYSCVVIRNAPDYRQIEIAVGVKRSLFLAGNRLVELRSVESF